MISKEPNENFDELRAGEPAIAPSRGADAEHVYAPGARTAAGDALHSPQRDPRAVPPDGADESKTEPLLAASEREDMRVRWLEIQQRFVDDPKEAVESADELIGEAIQRLSELFDNTRRQLEDSWGSGNESDSTEHLRQALRSYRAFFDQILSV